MSRPGENPTALRQCDQPLSGAGHECAGHTGGPGTGRPRHRDGARRSWCGPPGGGLRPMSRWCGRSVGSPPPPSRDMALRPSIPADHRPPHPASRSPSVTLSGAASDPAFGSALLSGFGSGSGSGFGSALGTALGTAFAAPLDSALAGPAGSPRSRPLVHSTTSAYRASPPRRVGR